MKKILDTLRFNAWWNFVLPPILGFIYLLVYVGEIEFTAALKLAGLLLLWMIGAAAYGYFLNDVCDLDSDERAGKRNYAAKISKGARVIIIFVAICLAVLPWLWLSDNLTGFVLTIIHLLLLTIYSTPPLRLKRFLVLGPVCDALYSMVIPIVIVLDVVIDIKLDYFLISMLIIILVWTFSKGMRNIINHQIDDRKNDRKSGYETLTTTSGPVNMLNLVNNLVLPVELVSVIVLCFLFSKFTIGFYLSIAIFLLFTFFKFSLWKVFTKIPKRQYRKKFLYFLNDYYEEWLPATALILLTTKDLRFAILLCVHFLLFPRGIIRFFKDLRTIANNITE